MQNKYLSCCYYPTTTVLLDDNRRFLNTLELSLQERFLCEAFTDTDKALVYCNEKSQNGALINKVIAGKEDVLTETSINIDIRKLHQYIFEPKRFSLPSIAVVDYSMPKIDGLSWCRKIENQNLKKILLTGEAGYDLAVEGFNDGLIDKFILKSATDLDQTLNTAIIDLQNDYFIKLSQGLLDYITSNESKLLSCLQDQSFINLVNNILKKHKIVEYYLMDTQGSFLMLDKDARPYWLAVKNDTEIEDLINFAKFEEAPKETIKQLQARSHIPFFFTDEDLQTPPADWGRFMRKATKLDCETGPYYYALITDPNAHELDRSKILSYADFLAAHE